MLRGDRRPPTIDGMDALPQLAESDAQSHLYAVAYVAELERLDAHVQHPLPPPLLSDTMISTLPDVGLPREPRRVEITVRYSGDRQPSVGRIQARTSINAPLWTVAIRKTGVKCPTHHVIARLI